MPWDRRRGYAYYYVPARVNGKPRRIYYGRGPAAHLHDLLTRQDRRERAERQQAIRVRKAEAAALFGLLRELLGGVRQLVRAVRLLNHEYQHKGQWRKRGMRAATTPPPSAGTDPIEGDLQQVLLELNERANRGDAAALDELRTLLDRHPAVWEYVGDLGRQSVARWGELLTDRHTLGRECLQRFMQNWKLELIGANTTPLLRVAVDAAAITLLAVRYAEAELSAATTKGKDAAVRRLTGVLKQHQEAIALVAAVRAGEVPAVSAVDPLASPGPTEPKLFAGG